MNREIKFRAWDTRYHIMTSAFSIHKTNFTKCPTWLPLQFTGLKDKNRKEIYEGDILKNYNGEYEVEFIYGSFLIRDIRARDENFGEDGEDYYYFHNDHLSEHAWKCEVIGNIYENPELLS